MEKIAVFVNDAEHALHIVQPMLRNAAPTHWIIVATPPTLTRHIGRWVSHSARQQWLERWSAELFAQLEPLLVATPGSKVEKMLVKRPLVEVSARLQARLGTVRLLDARRPRLGKTEEPISAGQPAHYIRGDLHPTQAHHQRIDLEALPFDNDSLDLVICNHILEHVYHPEKALSEIHRALRPGGIVIAQTPYAPCLKHTFETKTVPDAQTAHLLFGQADHVRLFGDDIADYFHAAGLKGDLLPHDTLLPKMLPADFGCNAREPFFVFWKPAANQAQADGTRQAEAQPA